MSKFELFHTKFPEDYIVDKIIHSINNQLYNHITYRPQKIYMWIGCNFFLCHFKEFQIKRISGQQRISWMWKEEGEPFGLTHYIAKAPFVQILAAMTYTNAPLPAFKDILQCPSNASCIHPALPRLSWDHPISCPVKFEDIGQEIGHVQDMSSKSPKPLTLSEKKHLSLFSIFLKRACLVCEGLNCVKMIWDFLWCLMYLGLHAQKTPSNQFQMSRQDMLSVWFEEISLCLGHVQDIPN